MCADPGDDRRVLASTLPDTGSFEFPPTVAMLFGFLVTAYALGCRNSRDDVQWQAFIGGFIGFCCGLVIYAFGHAFGLH